MTIHIRHPYGSRAARASRAIAIVLAVVSPLCAHAASVLGSPRLSIASVTLLAAAILIRPLAEGRRWVVLALPGVALALYGLWKLDAAALALLLPPVVVFIFLAWLFGHTLRRGSQPLIERLVRLLQPAGEPPEPAVIRYAGTLTRLWTCLFGAMALVNLVLAACVVPDGLLESAGIRAPFAVRRDTWSLFANLLNYAIVAAFFVLEYAYRRRRFPDRPYRDFMHFLRRVAAVGPALAATFESRRAGAQLQPADGGDIHQREILAPLEHPAYAGHFPGRPVLPGVLLLEQVIEAAEAHCGRPLTIVEIPRVKFLAPLLPGDRASLRLRREREMLHFDVRRGEVPIARGVFRTAGHGPAA